VLEKNEIYCILYGETKLKVSFFWLFSKMLLYKKDEHCWLRYQDKVFTHKVHWDELVNRTNLYAYLQQQTSHWSQVDFVPDLEFDPPIHGQEVWAAGVTYLRSKLARMEESKEAGGGDFYDKVYEADRPELFFKSQPYRVSGHKGKIRIRKDSSWNVPEPELTLFVCSAGTIEGYSIGNDMSSRSIEGENPLYLPQAKSYEKSTALGPCLFIPGTTINPDTRINLTISRNDQVLFDQSISISHMKRKHHELVDWLTREIFFPKGCYLMTGTGIVPPDSFTLKPGDVVNISIDHIGTLQNTVTI
jgi:2-dehydro-3-deoxy-D-arabinonate dehydratase